MRNLVWFRRDLRVRDQTALAAACREPSAEVVGVYVATPGQWRLHNDAPCKVAFWLANLKELSKELKRLNIPLRFEQVDEFAGVPGVLLRVAREANCDALYFNREYEVNERRRDEAVARAFEREGFLVHAFDDRAMLAPGSVLNKSDKPYTVFTPFRRAWIESAARNLDARALSVRRRKPIRITASRIPDRLAGIRVGATLESMWPGGESEASKRLKRFVERGDVLRNYHQHRDLPGVEGTSSLSPYLAAGVISPRECLRRAVLANGGRMASTHSGPTTWITELVWRDFYIHILASFPRLSMDKPFDPRTERVAWRDDPRSLEAWMNGRTGYPIVDAGMRQLLATGWMHNRLRMITAMFLSKHLLLDWRLGEAHFMRHLVDGDLAANNGGWQWSASTGSDAAPYFRVFNPWVQSRRFDPDAAFVRRLVPELRAVPPPDIHDPKTLAKHDLDRRGYPPPICDHAVSRRRAIEAFRRARG